MSGGRLQKKAVERLIDTAGGLLYVTYIAVPSGSDLCDDQLTIYPTTSARAEVPVADLFAIFRFLGAEANQAGYRTYSVRASRHRNGRERIIVFKRKL